jgi:DNA invertase Pin-like site-specific DNA recombinase
MHRIIGYLRADMSGQNVQSQVDQLKAAGATIIFQEQPTSAKRDRLQLDKLMTEVRGGDTVVVTSIDRIAHNIKHLLQVVESFNATGVTFKVIDNGIDTSTPHGKVIRTLLVAIADFERKMARESQAVGIARAKKEGRYKGRKPTAMAKAEEVFTLDAQGLTRQKIANQLGIGVASVYRILKKHSAPKKPHKKATKKTVDKPKRAERKPMREPYAEQLSFF